MSLIPNFFASSEPQAFISPSLEGLPTATRMTAHLRLLPLRQNPRALSIVRNRLFQRILV